MLIGVAIFALTTSIEAAPNGRLAIEDAAHLEFVNAVPKTVTYRGRKALRLTGTPDTNALALVNDLSWEDGSIDVDIAGLPGAGSSITARAFYLRPTNGRADDQLRRNHATQYVSEPDFPWQKLREETPGVYESYADLETGAWTHVHIEVAGVRARLFVNRSTQPTLIVNDLKRGTMRGQVGLWVGPGTEAYFRDLRVTSQ
jgi:hypothetical protein